MNSYFSVKRFSQESKSRPGPVPLGFRYRVARLRRFGLDGRVLRTELLRARESGSNDLLIALHGLGDSMEGYRWLPRMLPFPRLNILLVQAPDPYYTGYSWYDFAADPGPGVERSYQLLARLLDTLAPTHPAARIILFGFSQGSLMSIETGLRYAHPLGGIIGVSGYVHEPERLLRLASPAATQQAFLITHGTVDPLIPVSRVRPQVEQLRAAGMQIEFRTFEKDHTIIEPELALFREFIGKRLGYAPGSTPAGC